MLGKTQTFCSVIVESKVNVLDLKKIRDLYIPLTFFFFFFGKSTLRWMFLHLIDGDFGGTEDRHDLSRSS